MLTYLRYALATFCFTASVGCLALWWRSHAIYDQLSSAKLGVLPNWILVVSESGTVVARELPIWEGGNQLPIWNSTPVEQVRKLQDPTEYPRQFGIEGRKVYFPHWYPALVFALAGVATRRLGRRFTLRSAIIATTVVAELLGMAVVL